MKHTTLTKIAAACFALPVIAIAEPCFAQTGPTRPNKANVVPGSQSGTLQDSFLTAEQKKILSHLSIVELDDGAGGTVKTLRVTGINVQLVNGLNATTGYPVDPTTLASSEHEVNKLGNVIVGYNEPGSISFSLPRFGSHNVVFGIGNNFPDLAGIIGPRDASVRSPFSTVSGGKANATSKFQGFSEDGYYGGSITGGARNTVLGRFSAISGGIDSLLIGWNDSISGGIDHVTSNYSGSSSITGGALHFVYLTSGTISGGRNNQTNGSGASISGGRDNTGGIGTAFYGVYGTASSISGGQANVTTELNSSISGGQGNLTARRNSSISGGRDNATGTFVQYYPSTVYGATIAGGSLNQTYGESAAISGGLSHTTTGDHDWISGSLFEDN